MYRTNNVDGSSLRSLAREARESNLLGWARLLAVAIVLVGLMDAVSTELALHAGGAREANPVIRAIQDMLGSYWVAPKMVMHGALAWMVLWFPNRPTLLALTAVSALAALAAANNFAIYLDRMA